MRNNQSRKTTGASTVKMLSLSDSTIHFTYKNITAVITTAVDTISVASNTFSIRLFFKALEEPKTLYVALVKCYLVEVSLVSKRFFGFFDFSVKFRLTLLVTGLIA